MLTEIQKEKFKDVSGYDFTFTEMKGRFQTEFPNNDREWKFSPWSCTYIIDEETGNLFMNMSHRMTNNRVYGYDKDGNELDIDITDKYFKSYYDFMSNSYVEIDPVTTLNEEYKNKDIPLVEMTEIKPMSLFGWLWNKIFGNAKKL